MAENSPDDEDQDAKGRSLAQDSVSPKNSCHSAPATPPTPPTPPSPSKQRAPWTPPAKSRRPPQHLSVSQQTSPPSLTLRADKQRTSHRIQESFPWSTTSTARVLSVKPQTSGPFQEEAALSRRAASFAGITPSQGESGASGIPITENYVSEPIGNRKSYSQSTQPSTQSGPSTQRSSEYNDTRPARYEQSQHGISGVASQTPAGYGYIPTGYGQMPSGAGGSIYPGSPAFIPGPSVYNTGSVVPQGMSTIGQSSLPGASMFPTQGTPHENGISIPFGGGISPSGPPIGTTLFFIPRGVSENIGAFGSQSMAPSGGSLMSQGVGFVGANQRAPSVHPHPEDVSQSHNSGPPVETVNEESQVRGGQTITLPESGTIRIVMGRIQREQDSSPNLAAIDPNTGKAIIAGEGTLMLQSPTLEDPMYQTAGQTNTMPPPGGSAMGRSVGSVRTPTLQVTEYPASPSAARQTNNNSPAPPSGFPSNFDPRATHQSESPRESTAVAALDLATGRLMVLGHPSISPGQNQQLDYLKTISNGSSVPAVPQPGSSIQQPGYPVPGSSIQQPGYPAPGSSIHQPGYPAPGSSIHQPGYAAPGPSIQPGYPAPGSSIRQSGRSAQGSSIRQPGYPAQGSKIRQHGYSASGPNYDQTGYPGSSSDHSSDAIPLRSTQAEKDTGKKVVVDKEQMVVEEMNIEYARRLQYLLDSGLTVQQALDQLELERQKRLQEEEERRRQEERRRRMGEKGSKGRGSRRGEDGRDWVGPENACDADDCDSWLERYPASFARTTGRQKAKCRPWGRCQPKDVRERALNLRKKSNRSMQDSSSFESEVDDSVNQMSVAKSYKSYNSNTGTSIGKESFQLRPSKTRESKGSRGNKSLGNISSRSAGSQGQKSLGVISSKSAGSEGYNVSGQNSLGGMSSTFIGSQRSNVSGKKSMGGMSSKYIGSQGSNTIGQKSIGGMSSTFIGGQPSNVNSKISMGGMSSKYIGSQGSNIIGQKSFGGMPSSKSMGSQYGQEPLGNLNNLSGNTGQIGKQSRTEGVTPNMFGSNRNTQQSQGNASTYSRVVPSSESIRSSEENQTDNDL